MSRLLLSLLITAVSIYTGARLLPEHIMLEGFSGALYAAVVLGLVNLILGKVVRFVSKPLRFMTLGLFSLVINAILLLVVDYFVDGLKINGFVWALVLGVIISVMTSILEKLLNRKD